MLEESFSKEEQDMKHERKLVLEKIKLSKRPVDFHKLNEHARKHDRLVSSLTAKKNEQNRSASASLDSHARHIAMIPKYRSKYYMRNL